MKTLNLTEMEGINGGEAGITCTLEGRVEYGGLRISTWSCSNGHSMTNFSVKNDDGMWEVMLSVE